MLVSNPCCMSDYKGLMKTLDLPVSSSSRPCTKAEAQLLCAEVHMKQMPNPHELLCCSMNWTTQVRGPSF